MTQRLQKENAYLTAEVEKFSDARELLEQERRTRDAAGVFARS